MTWKESRNWFIHFLCECAEKSFSMKTDFISHNGLSCTSWNNKHPKRFSHKQRREKRKKVVNDLLHPFKPSFPNWFICAAVIKNISPAPWTTEQQPSEYRKDMFRGFVCFLLTALILRRVHDALTLAPTRRNCFAASIEFEGWTRWMECESNYR